MDRRAQNDQRVVVPMLAPVQGPEHQRAQEQQEQAAEAVADEDEPPQEQKEAGVHARPKEAQQQQGQPQHRGQDHAQVVVAEKADHDGVQHQERTYDKTKSTQEFQE